MDLIERRTAPRFQVSIEGTAKTQNGHSAQVTVSNISASGLQFSTAQHEIPFLFPDKLLNNTMDPVHIELHLKLPAFSDVEACTISIGVGIVYVKRTGIDECLVGVRFEAFAPGVQSLLENYITHLKDQPAKRIES